MFLVKGFSSRQRVSAGAMLAMAAFVIGLASGATIAPVTAMRGGEQIAPASPRTGDLRTAYPAEVLRVLDGDTFEARVALWPGLNTITRVRLRGMDAPELKARCHEERSKAEAAHDRLRNILDQGEVGISHVTLDKYGGRVVADASTHATPDIAAELIRGGHARHYDGGRRAGWCG
jgi:endonuclease YncB( thermonuclease family)